MAAQGTPWLRGLPAAEAGERLRPLLTAAWGCWERSAGTAYGPEAWYRLLVTALQAEAHSPEQAVALAAFCLSAEPSAPTPAARAALASEQAPRVLQRFAALVNDERLRSPDAANVWLGELRQHFRDSEGLRGRMVMEPLRAALTGDLAGPCLGNVTALLGATRCRQRAEAALAALGGAQRR